MISLCELFQNELSKNFHIKTIVRSPAAILFVIEIPLRSVLSSLIFSIVIEKEPKQVKSSFIIMKDGETFGCGTKNLRLEFVNYANFLFRKIVGYSFLLVTNLSSGEIYAKRVI